MDQEIERDRPPYRNPESPVEARVADLLGRMSLREKVEQMSTPGSSLLAGLNLLLAPFRTRVNRRLGIPGFVTIGSSRGANIRATAFPVAISRGASWDPDLEYRVHEVIGREAVALGANVLLSPTINLLRHPGWGRAQETYGEDPFHLGRMAVAAVEGAQRHLMAQVKHFALNSIEQNRFRVSAEVDERSLREVYLHAFERAVREAGAATVMASYNRINGQWASENRHLLRDILKGDWGFDGPVMSDWMHGVNSTLDAARNGLDMEMPVERFFGRRLLSAVREGLVDEAVIDEAVTRILRRKFEWGLFDHPSKRERGVVRCSAHRRLALEAARSGLVLLQNRNQVLPLTPESGSIAVLGPTANSVRLGDLGSSQIHDATAVSVLDGIRGEAGSRRVMHYGGRSARRIRRYAARADTTVVVASLGPRDEGEWIPEFRWAGLGGDRCGLRLKPRDERIIHEAARVSDRVVVILQAGGAIATGSWVDSVAGVIMAWYPGVEGGRAVAELLFGRIEPGGRLPVSFPDDDGQFYPLGKHRDKVAYGLLQGYRWLDARGIKPRFPFGFGLSYTRFDYSGLQLSRDAESGDIIAGLTLANTGRRRGIEVVQLYIGWPQSGPERAPRDLRGFRKVELDAGEQRHLAIAVALEDLAWYDPRSGEWCVEAGRYRVELGASSGDIRLSGVIELESGTVVQRRSSAVRASASRSRMPTRP